MVCRGARLERGGASVSRMGSPFFVLLYPLYPRYVLAPGITGSITDDECALRFDLSSLINPVVLGDEIEGSLRTSRFILPGVWKMQTLMALAPRVSAIDNSCAPLFNSFRMMGSVRPSVRGLVMK